MHTRHRGNARSILIWVSALLAFSALAACSSKFTPSGIGETATAGMAGPDGTPLGAVTLTQQPHGVLVQADLMGLPPGAHGFHIHETGACSPDFTAAGGHFNPNDQGHGLAHPDGFHPGDLPNIHAAPNGSARADYFTDGITLDDGADHSVFGGDGSAVIVHEKPDSYGADPGAGARIACGVIRRQ